MAVPERGVPAPSMSAFVVAQAHAKTLPILPATSGATPSASRMSTTQSFLNPSSRSLSHAITSCLRPTASKMPSCCVYNWKQPGHATDRCDIRTISVASLLIWISRRRAVAPRAEMLRDGRSAQASRLVCLPAGHEQAASPYTAELSVVRVGLV